MIPVYRNEAAAEVLPSRRQFARFFREGGRFRALHPGVHPAALAEAQVQEQSAHPQIGHHAPPEGRHAAAISLYPDETRETAELGWITNKAYWGHGIAFEAVQAVLRFAADELHIHRFIAHCDTENTASFHFMEKLGMTRIAEYGGRRNKGSDEERREYEYELKI